jgi:putative ABC transport system permease protein
MVWRASSGEPSASVVQIVALSARFHGAAAADRRFVAICSMPGGGRSGPEAPNRFVVNIQPDQVAPVRAALAAEGVSTELAPMVRGRLTRINGLEVSAASYTDDRAQRLIEREFNLSMRPDLPAGNRLSGRALVFAGRSRRARGTMRRLGRRGPGADAGAGRRRPDRVRRRRRKIGMTVVGLRKVNWDTMRANFFVLTPPVVLEGYPASWITSFYLSPEQAEFVNRLIRDFPNLTVIDVAAILRQLQSIMDQVARAVQFVFLFTLAAGVIVLYAALASAAEERRYELAVMRALGARREQLRRALLAEFAAIGGLCRPDCRARGDRRRPVSGAPGFPLRGGDRSLAAAAGVGCGAMLVTAAGWFAAARLLQSAPLEALRAGSS